MIKKARATEMKAWKYMRADMMSEEENDGDGFIRHRYSWRSDKLNKFIEKLDKRHGKSTRAGPAKKRIYGQMITKQTPENLPPWMVAKADADNDDTAAHNEDALSEVEGPLQSSSDSDSDDLFTP